MKTILQTTFLSAVLTLGVFSSVAQALPNHPPLLMNGKLGLTYLEVQEQKGSKWVRVSRYSTNKKYRFRMRFTNYFKPSEATNINRVFVWLKIKGVAWEFQGKFSNEPKHWRQTKEFISWPNIPPGESVWKTTSTYMWKGAPAPTRAVSVETKLKHYEEQKRGNRYRPKSGKKFFKVFPK